MKKFLLTLPLLAGTSLFAALSPLNESIVEIGSILKDPRLTDSLPTTETLQEIIRAENGYLIISDNYQMAVDIAYQAATQPGPQKFKLTFHSPEPLQEQKEYSSEEEEERSDS